MPGRLAHMDKMGVDVQVIFPTFFIRYNTSNAEAEWALTTTYNRWLAEKCATTNGRLRWAVVLPLLNPDKAVEELRWAKEHGACGIFKRGFDLDRKVTDPHFFPVYEEASALDLPLCIHTGHPLPGSEWDRGFPDHVLLHRAGELRNCEEVSEASLRPHRVGSLVDPLHDLPAGSGKASVAARSTDSIAAPLRAGTGFVPREPLVRHHRPDRRHRVVY